MNLNASQSASDAQNLEALLASLLAQPTFNQQLASGSSAQRDLVAMAIAQHAQGLQDMLDFSNYAQFGAQANEFMLEGNNYAVGCDSPDGSEATLADLNPFGSLVIPSDKNAAADYQASQQYYLFPTVNHQFQVNTSPSAILPPSPPLPANEPTPSTQKREHRGLSVAWQPAPGRAPMSRSTPPATSPAVRSMPSPPQSPTASVKDEANACAPSLAVVGALALAPVAQKKETVGIRTPFDDMNDEELDDLDEDEIMGMMGKTTASLKRSSDGPDGSDKKKRRCASFNGGCSALSPEVVFTIASSHSSPLLLCMSVYRRRTTAELAPQELEVRRIKNSEAARRCRLRKTLKLRWLESRCTELEDTNNVLMEKVTLCTCAHSATLLTCSVRFSSWRNLRPC
ncbi:hypothetical protein HDU93_003062 [Gonapodya sp. JEL0774]|nr:hypothetical protein HDU93_003062 [Gonapodya sp. JEL0774]